MVTVINDPACIGYSHAGHPEKPERIAHSLDRLKSQKDVRIAWESPGPCPDEAVLLAHIPDHLVRLRIEKDFDPDTPFVPGIVDYARSSAGAALKGLALAREGKTVFSLMRPPGHHATKARAMGFCYLNNAAIATLQARAQGVERVAVFDFDVHHGNGTEAILLDVPGTSFFSVHQFPCYPGTGTRNQGANCFNYPVAPRTHREEYRHILRDAFEHLKKLDPNLIIVSAGFDAYVHDPLSQETLEIDDYEWLGGLFRDYKVPALHLLEGGYSDALPELILSYLKGLDPK